MSTLIIGTAGHIDHGKTSLVRHLTGVDLDQSPEEKQRGITISLGFTHLDLENGKRVAFVDVRGHEKLIRTMIAGATGIDAVLLCVSAVEGVMPQTREHLSILHLLGVKHGIIAMTMTDLADPDLIELAELDIEEACLNTFLEGAPIIKTASGPKPIGQADLIDALMKIPFAIHDSTGPFRLPIDRVFLQKGFGAIVTGTARNGTVEKGVEIEVVPEGLHGRARTIQVHNAEVSSASPGQRVAVNIAGIHHDELKRGSVIMPKGAITPTSILDCSYSHLADSPEIEDGARVRFLSGSTEALARITVIDGTSLQGGKKQIIQLRTEKKVVLLPNDRFILRRESPLQTLGGGKIIDPWSRRIRQKNKDSALPPLRAIINGDNGQLLSRRGREGAKVSTCNHWGVKGDNLDDRCYSPEAIVAMRRDLLQEMNKWHQINPLKLGISSKALHQRTVPRLSSKAFEILMAQLIHENKLEQKGPWIQAVDFDISLNDDQRKMVKEIREKCRKGKWQGAELSELGEQSIIQYLIDTGEITRIQSMAFLPVYLEDLKTKLRIFFEKNELMEPSDFKTITQLSRKFAIPLLEWLDQQGFTQRKGNGRTLR